MRALYQLVFPQTKSTLSQPKWPSYKLHGVTQSKFLDACPTNLHTSVLSVVPSPDGIPNSPSISDILASDSISTSGSVSGSVTGSISGRSMLEIDSEDEVLLTPPNCHTSYCVTTMQIPTATECSGAVSAHTLNSSHMLQV